MQCAPTFGAVPSAADVKKKQEEAAMVEEKRDEILMQLMNKEVAMRLNAMEVDNPAKVSRVRDQILAQRAHWRLNGPFNEQNLAELLKNMEVTTENTRGVALNRGRAFDDDDSDVDLDGL